MYKEHESKIEAKTNKLFDEFIDKEWEKELNLNKNCINVKIHFQDMKTLIRRNLRAQKDNELSEGINTALIEAGLDFEYISI